MLRPRRGKDARSFARAARVPCAVPCLLSAMLAACASKPTTRATPSTAHEAAPAALTAPAPELAASTPVPAPTLTLESIAATILPGIDLAPSRDDWQIGDQVLVEVRAVKPEGKTERLVLVELTRDIHKSIAESYTSTTKGGRKYVFESLVAKTRITLFDETGAQIAEATGRFPIKLLGCGPFDGAEPMLGKQDAALGDDGLPQLTDAEYDRVMRGWGALFTFSGSLGKKGMFKSMLEDVIVKPSLLRMLFHPTASLTFGEKQWPEYAQNGSPSAAASEPGSTFPSLRTIHIPLELRIADLPALTGDLLAAEPVAPLSLCGGLIHAEGRRPDDPSVRVELRLLGAKRGTGGKTFEGPPVKHAE